MDMIVDLKIAYWNATTMVGMSNPATPIIAAKKAFDPTNLKMEAFECSHTSGRFISTPQRRKQSNDGRQHTRTSP